MTLRQQNEDLSKALYISSRSGSNTNTGKRESPLKSCEPLFDLIKYDSTFSKYTHILFEAGTVIPEGLSVIYGGWRYGSLSKERPLIIGAYGEGERPIVAVRQGQNGIYIKDSPGNITIRDLEFVGTNAGKGVEVFGPQNNIRVENCKIREFAYGMAFDCQQTGDSINDVVIDNCIVIDNKVASPDAFDKGSQGMYISQTKGMRIRNTVVDNNGLSNTFCHGLYCVQSNHDLLIEDSYISRNGFAGAQLRGRNQSCVNSMLFGNANNAGLGHHMSTTLANNQGDFIWYEGQFNNNLIGYAVDLQNPAGQAGVRGWAISYHRCKGAEIKNNIIVGDNRTGSRIGFQRPLNAPSDQCDTSNNVIVGYDTEKVFATAESPNESYENNSYRKFQNQLPVNPVINYEEILKMIRDRRRNEKFIPPSIFYTRVAGALGVLGY